MAEKFNVIKSEQYSLEIPLAFESYENSPIAPYQGSLLVDAHGVTTDLDVSISANTNAPAIVNQTLVFTSFTAVLDHIPSDAPTNHGTIESVQMKLFFGNQDSYDNEQFDAEDLVRLDLNLLPGVPVTIKLPPRFTIYSSSTPEYIQPINFIAARLTGWNVPVGPGSWSTYLV